MRSVDEFIKVTAMPEIDSLLDFRPLPTDQIRLARTVMMVKKRLRARWVDGIDGDFSLQAFFKKIGKTSLFIVFVRDKSLDRVKGERGVAARSRVSKQAQSSADLQRTRI
ncbi:hypothetical protein N7451_005351 [Penicillium sp. IBT 35674x]|nr:hypothetical protein N7451_005351 [Penicillium sp. IBT 35674x]